eukprot:gene25469-25616_t
MTLNACLYSALAVFLWFQGTAAGMAFALLSLCGSLINNALQMAQTPRALPSVIGPPSLYIVGLPLVTGLMSPAQDAVQMALIATGGLVYILHTLMAVKRIWTTSRQTEAAIEAAQKIVVRAGQLVGMDDPILWIEVEDSGSGMDAETAGRIFSSFEQGSSGVTRAHGGTGLGLAISR